MLGIVWYVQLVQYPLFASVGVENWTAFEQDYTRRAGWVIAPLMLIELATAVMLGVFANKKTRPWLWLNLLLLAIIWASTFAIQVPLHQALTNDWSVETWESLVASNWIRTVLWSLRTLLLLTITHKWRNLPS